MIVIDDTVVSDELVEKQFVCDLHKCQGACCVEGDLGAPLEAEECDTLDEIYERVAPYLSEAGRAEVERQGRYVIDADGDFSTPTVGGRECAYAVYDARGILQCGIEAAHRDGAISFPKPISCHLYPVRITKYDHYEALNYHRWHICNPACHLGAALQMPVFRFLKDALIRKYGPDWYEALEATARQMGAPPPETPL